MNKNKLKKSLFIAFILLFCIYYILFPAQVSACAKAGIMLWFNQIFPMLFIFTILSNLIISTNVLQSVPNKYILLLTYFIGLIFGFPIGAKLTADFYYIGYIDQKHAEILSALSNHFSLPFIITYALSDQLGIHNHYSIYLVSLYLPSVFGVLIMLSLTKNGSDFQSHNLSNTDCLTQKIPAQGFKLNMQIVDAGIMKGFETLIKLCGYIVLFSIIARMPRIIADKAIIQKPVFIDIISSFLEATNGISIICEIPVSHILTRMLCIALLSFGGISCIVQTKSIFQGQQYNLKNYILLKSIMSISSCLIFIMLFCILV